MSDVFLSLIVIAFAVALGVLVHRIRSGTLSPVLALAVTAASGTGLIFMVLTDWPIENLAGFWADHSVLASMLSSVLLVGLVFMVYERAERQRQEELSAGLSGAGAGGLVDHLVDVEVALALVAAPTPPDEVSPQHWLAWDEGGRPLRWLRADRAILDGSAADPRTSDHVIGLEVPAWGSPLIEQSIRRLLAGMRDWSPLVGASEPGTAALLLLSAIRSDLMALNSALAQTRRGGPPMTDDLTSRLTDLRARVRILALCFEEWSGAPTPRPEVLQSWDGLEGGDPSFSGITGSLRDRVDAARRRLDG